MTTSKDPEQKGDDANASKAPKPEQQQQKQQHQQPHEPTPAATQKNPDKRAGSDAKDGAGSSSNSKSASPPKKRRKVNHACIYCRRSKTDPPGSAQPADEDQATKLDPTQVSDAPSGPLDQRHSSQDAALGALAPPPLPHALSNAAPGPIAQPAPVSAPHASNLAGNSQSFLNYNDWNLGASNSFQDMHAFHPSYMFNASEASNEYNLLNDLFSNSLMDDGALYNGEEMNSLFPDQTLTNTMNPFNGPGSFMPGNHQNNSLLPPSQAAAGNAISRPTSGFPLDKAREAYYMTAADPAGNDTPEERMNKLLKAKFDAGMLKPFNYIKGYARLYQYMERNFQVISRQKILRCMDRFRPKFRERVHTLTDIELVRVEMWFERRMMEYDRVFASMAIPACCWRRTGEIFRGNKEMAELVHVPIENLRDGKVSLHEIVEEKSLVSYWEKFGAIAFDSSQKAILTSCSLKNPKPDSKDPEIRCCFSFTIRRDAHNM
ncbi:putative zn cluster transcription factor rds2 protein [Neofusicoccum parvum UCRNP2]|uniref:Putative zn cluster transcription factor rds2 protein n=1 Tax=Botryosphaeria parva (strain UCR-NP2) TaxID=1287680 RepID=R1G972_BOTPV|nr:putative zn cluster transcription factor rds2 protein [Neofusicoccum parvum UCRNP2]